MRAESQSANRLPSVFRIVFCVQAASVCTDSGIFSCPSRKREDYRTCNNFECIQLYGHIAIATAHSFHGATIHLADNHAMTSLCEVIANGLP